MSTNTQHLDKVTALGMAISDTNRVRALMALCGGELCVCQVIELLQLAPSTVSKHMTILKHAGLVQSRKSGRWVYYRLSDQAPALGSVFENAFALLERDAHIIRDVASMKKIRGVEMEMLCKQQRKRGKNRR